MDFNHPNAIPKFILDATLHDKKSVNFYDSINPFFIPTDANDLYKKIEESDNLITIGKERPFPSIVLNAITPFTSRVYFGAILMLSRFYCIIDNSVYFWSTNYTEGSNESVEFYVEEDSTFISAVTDGYINTKAFDEKKCKGVIVYAIDKYVKIIPTSDKKIYFDWSIKFKVKFHPTAFYTNKSGTIYIATVEGDIYSLVYDPQNRTKCDVKIKNLTENYFLRFFPKIIFRSTPIYQVAVDEETQIMATLHADSIIRFYRIGEDHFQNLFKFEPKEDPHILNIASVPLGCSNSVKFVAFSEDGTRICFDVDRYLGDVTCRSLRPPPPNDDIFFRGILYPSFCVFLYEKSIVITQEKPELDQANSELFIVFPLKLDVLAFAQNIPDMKNTELVNNQFFWQHLFSPDPAYLFTSTGIRIINFPTPCEKFLSFFDGENKSHLRISQPLKSWASLDYIESTATALLLAKKLPDKKDDCLYFIMKTFDDSKLHKKDEFLDCFAILCFIVRISRILYPVFTHPLFDKNGEDTYELFSEFKKPPLNYKKEIKIVKSLCDDYYNLLVRSNHPKDEDTLNLPLLSAYLTDLEEILRLIKIISKVDDNIISQILNKMDSNNRDRLFNLEFGSGRAFDRTESFSFLLSPSSDSFFSFSYINSLFRPNPDINEPLNFDFYQQHIPDQFQYLPIDESLHEFCMEFYEVSPFAPALSEIEHKCPRFFTRSDIIVMDSIKVIREKIDNSEGALTQAVESLLKNASRPMNLKEICTILTNKKCFNLALKLCMAKANASDPSKSASHWFFYEMQINGSEGRNEFDKRYEMYEIIFDLVDLKSDDMVESILKVDDQMFHFCFFHHLNQKGQIERIFSKKFPSIESYIKSYASHFLFSYYAMNGQYHNAALHLWDYIDKNVEIPLFEKIRLLKLGVRYSFECNALKNNFSTLLKLSEIQYELMERVVDKEDYEYHIMSSYDLFLECVSYKSWDLALRLLSFSSFKQNKELAIAQIWENFMFQRRRNMHSLDFVDAVAALKYFFSFLDVNSDVAKPEIVVPILESFRMQRNGNKYAMVHLFIDVGYDISCLAAVYCKMASDKFTRNDVKLIFIDIFSFLLSKGAYFDKGKAEALKNWFVENAKEYQDYEDILSTFKKYL